MSTTAEEPRRKTTVRLPGMDPFAGELLDTLQAHLKALEARMKSAEDKAERFGTNFLRLFAVGGVLTLCLFVYMLSIIGESRGVDTSKAASSTATVLSATSDAVTTGTTTTTTTTTEPTPEEH